MSKCDIKLYGVHLAFVILVMFTSLGCNSGPVYKGKSAQTWLKEARRASNQPDLAWGGEAFRLNRPVLHSLGGRKVKAATMLGMMGKNCVPRLVEALKKEKDWKARPGIILALGECGADAAEAVPLISEYLGAEDMVRCAAAFALGNIGPASASAIPNLKNAMERSSSNAVFRTVGKTAIFRIETDVQVLIHKLSGDRRDYHTQDTVYQIGLLGERAEGAVPILVQILDTTFSEMLAKQAIEALGKIGPRASDAVDILLQRARSPKFGVGAFEQALCACALGRIAPYCDQSEEVLAILRELSNSKYENVREAAAEAIAAIEE